MRSSPFPSALEKPGQVDLWLPRLEAWCDCIIMKACHGCSALLCFLHSHFLQSFDFLFLLWAKLVIFQKDLYSELICYFSTGKRLTDIKVGSVTILLTVGIQCALN